MTFDRTAGAEGLSNRFGVAYQSGRKCVGLKGTGGWGKTSLVCARVLSEKGSVGDDAQFSKCHDQIQAGVIDPKR